MFKTHAAAIAAYARRNPESMSHVLFFAVATANCPFMQSVNTMRLLKGWGDDLPFVVYSEITMEQKSAAGCGLTASKLSAYLYLHANRDDIFHKYNECLNLPNGHLLFWEYILDCLPGMGMVKAAFAVQMLFNKLGCIDIHNARELGYDKAPSGRARKNRPTYLEIQAVKTSEQWWDDWCNMLAEKYPAQFTSGEHVSELHQWAIVGGG